MKEPIKPRRPRTRPVRPVVDKQLLDQKIQVIFSDEEWHRKLSLTRTFYLSDNTHGGNIWKLAKYQGFDPDIIRRAIYDGIGSDPPWEYAKFKQVETLKQEMRAVTAEFHRFIEATNLPELKNVVRLGTEVLKRGLVDLHANPVPMGPKELGQVAGVIDTCYKIVRLIEDKPTQILGVENMTPDKVREGMQALIDVDKGVIDWDEVVVKTDKVN